MSNPREKDALDLAIDFFFGAVFSGGAGGLLYARTGGWHFTVATLCVVVVTWAMMGGALAAMYREDFWASYERYTIIPPMRERVSLQARVILWSVFGAALAMLLLYIALSPKPVSDYRMRSRPPGASTQ